MPHEGRNFALAAMLSFVLTGCATAQRGGATNALDGARYVAMGSSFAAGQGIGALQAGSPARCSRTTNNYATLLAQRLHLRLTDVSCGGAVTANILGPWAELPAQIDAVSPDTRLVTITIGGNDVGYVRGLVGASCRAGVIFRPGPCFSKPTQEESVWRMLEQNLGEISRQVAIRAPGAKLIFVQYMTLVPPVLCNATVLPQAEANEFRIMGQRLANVTTRVARAHGATVLPIDRLSRDHTPCSAVPWSHGMSGDYDVTKGAPWHPNSDGHAAIAQALVERLDNTQM